MLDLFRELQGRRKDLQSALQAKSTASLLPQELSEEVGQALDDVSEVQD